MKGLSVQTTIEAQIGFLIGIILGAMSSYVFIMFFVDWAWYFKFFTTVGYIGIFGSLVLSLIQTIGTRRQYLEAKKTMEQ